MKTLEELLKELDEAEREYREKCEKYGIAPKKAPRAKNTDEETASK